MHALPNLLMSKRCLHVFHRSVIQSECNSRLAHCNTLFQLNSSPRLRFFSAQLPVRFAHFQTTASISTGSLPAFLQFARTQLRNATHRDLLRFRYSSSRRPPRRPNWLDSINGNVIFVAILAINGGVFLLWQGAKSTYVRSRHYALIKTEV
jgi:rhomboid-like protein